MFRVISIAIFVTSLSLGSSLQCNQCTNSAIPTDCLNPAPITCSPAVSIATQSQLLGNYNFELDISATTFKCMSLNSTFVINGLNHSLTVEGCVPDDFNICGLTPYSFETEHKHSCAICRFDECNNFNEKGNIALDCYQCKDEQSCKNPSKVTCDLNSAISTMQGLLQYYQFSFPNVSPNDTFSCFTSDTVFSSIVPGLTPPSLMVKGCVSEGFQACSLTPQGYLETSTSKCYVCDEFLCNS
ncbi:hypothetical protein ACFFRR_004636 [Megaselia abdita]